MARITVTDVTLRDGNHTIGHQFTPDQMSRTAAALDAAGVDIIEVGHGDGLGGSSRHVGMAAASDEEYLSAVVSAVKNSRVAALLVPGIGTLDDLRSAAALGIEIVRVGTHCTEADITGQHIRMGKDLGLMVIGYLISCSMTSPANLAEQTKLMESYGADAVYMADSAGELLPDDVKARVSAVRKAVEIPIGFHGHNSLGAAIGNTLAAIDYGATMVDGSLKGFGGGAGNTQTEVLVAALKRAGYETGVDLYEIMDAAEKVFAPLVNHTPVIDSQALLLGYSGVYGGYINPVNREAKRLGVDPRDIIVELGKRQVVAGQEDVVIQVARELVRH